MAIRPEISLQARVPDFSRTFVNALTSIQKMDEIKRDRAQRGSQDRFLEARAQSAEAQVPSKQAQFNTEQRNLIRSLATGARQIIPDLEADNTDSAIATMQRRSTALEGAGVSNTETQEGIGLARNNPQELLRRSRDLVALDDRINPQQGRSSPKAFAPITDPKTGQQSSTVFDPNTNSFSQVQIPGATQLTPAERSEIAVTEAGGKEAAKLQEQIKTKPEVAARTAAATQAIAKSGKAFDRLEKINLNISNYDEAIGLIDQGAQTGAITSIFPSLKAATVQLENLQGRLGLDVIGNTTFGALSESELKFALRVALPTKLSPPELRKWLVRKKEATQKLSRYVAEAAQFLGSPGNTIGDFIALQEVNQLEKEDSPQDLSTLSLEQLMELRGQVQ